MCGASGVDRVQGFRGGQFKGRAGILGRRAVGDAGEISDGEIGFRWCAGEGKGEEGDDRWVRSVSGGAGDALAGAGRRAGRAGPRCGLLAQEGKGRR